MPNPSGHPGRGKLHVRQETARVHHAARRRGSRVAARGTRAAVDAALMRMFTNERNAKGQYLPGVSGNPGGEPGWIRKRFTADFLTAFHRHFQHEGARVIAKVAKQQPAAYLRCLTMLVPKEMKVEQTGGIKAMTDEQLDEALAALRDLLARREAAARGALASPTVIEGQLASPGVPEPDEECEKPALDADK